MWLLLLREEISRSGPSSAGSVEPSPIVGGAGIEGSTTPAEKYEAWSGVRQVGSGALCDSLLWRWGDALNSWSFIS